MIRKSLLLLILVVLCMGSATSFASEAGLRLPGHEEFLTCDHFSDNLWGLHSTLEEKYGLSFELLYLQDIFWNTRGGINTHDSGEYPRLFGLYVELDTAKAGLWENGTFFLGLEHISGRNPSETQTGDWQWLSWLSSYERRNQVSEFWYKHTFFDEKLWIKLGKMESNYDFNYMEYSLEFLNSSAMFNPTLIALPTYPDQDWGAVIGVNPAQWFSCNFGVYQGKINGSRSVGNTLDDLRGPMLIVEPSFKYDLGGLPGKVNVGAWWNGRRFDAYHKHPTTHEYHGKAYGFYGFVQQLLWKENPDAEDCSQGIGVFAEYGWAAKDRSEIEDFAGGGLRWQGAIPGRDDDVMGLGAFTMYFSDQAGFADHSETALELFYKIQLTGWMALQPDVQYITNPGGDGNRNAVAVGGRLEFVF
ncbi:MAG: carbohydrate porin [Deltaproteobacteria bacterium]|nr:carbohydrate porin [Deltaproteobacteria bacterium]